METSPCTSLVEKCSDNPGSKNKGPPGGTCQEHPWHGVLRSGFAINGCRWFMTIFLYHPFIRMFDHFWSFHCGHCTSHPKARSQRNWLEIPLSSFQEPNHGCPTTGNDPRGFGAPGASGAPGTCGKPARLVAKSNQRCSRCTSPSRALVRTTLSSSARWMVWLARLKSTSNEPQGPQQLAQNKGCCATKSSALRMACLVSLCFTAEMMKWCKVVW